MPKLKHYLKEYWPSTWDEWVITVLLNCVPFPGVHPVGYVFYIQCKKQKKG